MRQYNLLISLIILSCISMGALASVNSATDRTDWPMYQGNSEHTGYHPASYPHPEKFKLKWHQKILSNFDDKGYPFHSGFPIIIGQMLFVNHTDFPIVQLNAQTGEVVKQFTKNFDYIDHHHFYERSNNIAYWNKHLIVQGTDSYRNDFIEMINTDNKYSRIFDERARRHPAIDPVGGTPTIVGDHLYANMSMTLLDFDLKKASTHYKQYDGAYIVKNARVDMPKGETTSVSNKYIISFSYNYTYNGPHNELSGTLRGSINSEFYKQNDTYEKCYGVYEWMPRVGRQTTRNNHYEYGIAPAINTEKETVFFTQFGYLSKYTFGLDNYNCRIDGQTGGRPFSSDYDIGKGVHGQPAIDESNVYVLRDDNLIAVDQDSGAIQWEWHSNRPDEWYEVHENSNEIPVVKFAPIVTKNLIFIASNKTTFAIDKKSHQTVWSYPVGGKLVISHQALFVVSDHGNIYAFSLGSE